MKTVDHVRWMNEALMLARNGEGLTRPNPPVGAVVVRGGRRVGHGWHARAGGPHAEVGALAEAGRLARGAVLYVTLEPCCTWGRTPPCTEAIKAAGIREVVVGALDPNPRHRGRGLRVLRQAGIRVRTGVGAEAAKELIRPFASWITGGRPWVTLKLAVSLDGRIADGAGHSKWITGTAARRCVQDLRRRADAVLVGAETVRTDDPSLLPRPAKGRRPWRVVAAGASGLPVDAQVLTDDRAEQTLICATAEAAGRMGLNILDHGAQMVVLPADAGGMPSLRELLHHLGSLGALHVVCEGGGELAASLIREGLVDEYLVLVAPKIIGGRAARPAVGGEGWPVSEARRLEWISVDRAGPDLVIRARPVQGR